MLFKLSQDIFFPFVFVAFYFFFSIFFFRGASVAERKRDNQSLAIVILPSQIYVPTIVPHRIAAANKCMRVHRTREREILPFE